jgi:hypothetical protein
MGVKHKTGNILVALLVSFVLVGLIVTSFLYWQTKNLSKSTPSVEIKKPEGETANWKTYTDKINGFSINYPANWTASKDDSLSVTFSNPQLPFPSPAVGWIEIAENWSLDNEKENSILRMTYVDNRGNVTGYGPIINQGIFDIQDKKIAGIDGKAYKLTTQEGLTNQYFAIANGGKTYKIGYNSDGQDRDKFLKVVSTFKFIDQSSVCELDKDYENTAAKPVTCVCPEGYKLTVISMSWGACPQPEMHDCPASTMRCQPSSKKMTGFVCPANGWVDCMPTIAPEKQNPCSDEAMEWYEENCPNFQGGAQ